MNTPLESVALTVIMRSTTLIEEHWSLLSAVEGAPSNNCSTLSSARAHMVLFNGQPLEVIHANLVTGGVRLCPQIMQQWHF